jgi:hypothetical protein
VIRKVPLYMLPQSGVSAISTLYIPPAAPPRPDYATVQQLGLHQPQG